MRSVTFSNCVDERVVELGYPAPEMLATESYQANIDVASLLLVAVILQDLFHQLVPLLIDKDIISK